MACSGCCTCGTMNPVDTQEAYYASAPADEDTQNLRRWAAKLAASTLAADPVTYARNLERYVLYG